MLRVVWEELSVEEKRVVNDLAQASYLDIVKMDKIPHYTEGGLLRHHLMKYKYQLGKTYS